MCESIVQLEDICPTVLDMAGEAMPLMPKMGPALSVAAEDIPCMPGRSLLPLCRGEDVEEWRNAAYSESYNHINSAHPEQWARTIRTDRYRYTFYPNDGEQMFDLKEDPDELNNVYGDPAYAEIQSEMEVHLQRLRTMYRDV